MRAEYFFVELLLPVRNVFCRVFKVREFWIEVREWNISADRGQFVLQIFFVLVASGPSR